LIGGFDIRKTFKYKSIKTGNDLVAIVIDNLASTNPWKPRGVKIHGTAEIIEAGERSSLLITPQRLWSWGVEETGLEGYFREAKR
jgi:pyridoxamine 5'-phosphate oxidase family protein